MKVTIKEKKEIEGYIGDCFYNESGYRKLNGSYAEYKIKKILKLDAGEQFWYKVDGHITYGVDDTGSGHTEKITDESEVFLYRDKETKKLKFMDGCMKDEVEEQFELIEDD